MNGPKRLPDKIRAMNENKLQKLFAAARRETGPVPPADFAGDVLRIIRHEPATRFAGGFLLFDSLNRWFPRLALAAVTVILLCASADFVMSATGLPEVDDGATQVSAQYFLNVEDM